MALIVKFGYIKCFRINSLVLYITKEPVDVHTRAEVILRLSEIIKSTSEKSKILAFGLPCIVVSPLLLLSLSSENFLSSMWMRHTCRGI